MGVFEIGVRVANPEDQVFYRKMMLVDTGAAHSALPASFLEEELGLVPDYEREYELANHELQSFPVGEARFRIGNREGTARVIFGTEGMFILGATTLQALELIPDTTNHQLVDAPVLLSGIHGEAF